MLASAASEPTPEAIMVLPQREGKLHRLKADTEWYHSSRLRVMKLAQLGTRMESAIWRHNSETAFYFYFCCLWTILLVFMCIFVPLLLPRLYDNSDEHCAPDGSFRLEPFSLLDPAWTFQVVISFGSLDFTVVKIIDIIWDVVIGRGGQTFLAYVTWKAFSKYLSSIMTTDHVTYQTFWTIFIQDGPSLISIFYTYREFTRGRGLRSKTAMGFIVLAMIFVLIFPTLVNSMAGYSASNQAMIKTDDINQVPFSKFQKGLYVLHDGNRVGISVEHIILDETLVCGSSDCVFSYISKYGVLSEKISTWNGTALPPPTLNISPYWYGDISAESLSGKVPFIYENKFYAPEYFTNGRAICQPVVGPNQPQQKYQWGFSIIQLEITLCFLTLWSLGICIIWATAHLRLRSMGTSYNASGRLKSAITLADAVRKEFKQTTEKDIDVLAEREVLSYIKQDLNGGRVMQVKSLPSIQKQSGWNLIQKWVKANKAWAVAIPLLSFGTVALAAALIIKTALIG